MLHLTIYAFMVWTGTTLLFTKMQTLCLLFLRLCTSFIFQSLRVIYRKPSNPCIPFHILQMMLMKITEWWKKLWSVLKIIHQLGRTHNQNLSTHSDLHYLSSSMGGWEPYGSNFGIFTSSTKTTISFPIGGARRVFLRFFSFISMIFWARALLVSAEKFKLTGIYCPLLESLFSTVFAITVLPTPTKMKGM